LNASVRAGAPLRALFISAAALLMTACATTGPAVAPSAKAAAPAPAGAGEARPASAPPAAAAPPTAPAAPAAGAPRPFAEIVKDAKRTDGLFPIWQKDDRTWVEIPADMLDKPFFLAINLSRGIGQNLMFAGMMGDRGWGIGGEYVAEFRRVGNNVQLIARNTTFFARPGSPEERAVRRSFSDSLLAAAPLAAAPHPERKALLVDANTLLMADIPRASAWIETTYRNSFGFEARNSFFESVKTDADRTVFDVTAHYSQARIPVPPPPPTVPGATPAPFYPPPSVIEDPRSLFLGFLYVFSKLPERPMAPRLADARIGHFTTTRVDFSDESRLSPVRFYVQRWRLEKKDPAAALSEPVKPITFWLGNEIPEKHRAPIREGILEWNKAFERIGFKDAIVVKQQPDDATFDLGETQYASIRWMTTANPAFGAIGPTQVDPRSGEILDADIGWDASQTRNVRALRTEGVVSYQPMYDEATGDLRVGAVGADGKLCTYREQATREVGFALALLEARGELDPDGPEADKLVADFLKDVTMHEVGHTLGLRHNFRASIVATQRQISDRAYAAKNGLTGSVMEYTPVNLALKGEPQGAYFTPTLGAYDYWAVEYAYRPLDPASEKAELARIAARSTERELAFATDEDVRFAIDPLVNHMDLGADPLAFYTRRVKLSQELWVRLEQRQLAPGESYAVLRRRFLLGFNQLGEAMGLAAKYVGGAELTNDAAGATRLPITPVSAKEQRQAMKIINDGLLRSDAFRVSPEFLRKLSADRLTRAEIAIANPAAAGGTVELALSERVLTVQRDVLNRLMSPVVARRVVEANAQAKKGTDVFRLSELYGTLQVSIWEEARLGVEADPIRRNLQREHLRRVSGVILGPSAAYPADARSLMRANARQLQGWLVAAAAKPGLSAETRAHYVEAAETLAEALKAPLIRSGV
jgi:hypothetical protein